MNSNDLNANRNRVPVARKRNMKPQQYLRVIGLASLSCVMAGSVLAQGRDANYFYGGIGLGGSQARIDDKGITARLRSAGLATSTMALDESSATYKIFGGYQFTPNWGVEAGYFDLGKFGFASTTVPLGTLTGQAKFRGLNVDLVGTLPLDERWSLLGRVGVQYTKTRDTFARSGAVTVADLEPRHSGVNYKAGLGVQYAINSSFLIRGEVERYRVNDAVGNRGDINVATISLVIPFGGPSAMPVRNADQPPAPSYVAPAAAPVVLAPATANTPVRRVSFSADSLFGFDQSEVTELGKASLDRFSAELAQIQFDVITVEGHTDRLGAVVYNERLSLKRAQAVRNYLTKASRIDPRKVTAIAKASTVAVTKPGECKGNKPTADLIACLQPDRRVEVEVSGTR